ncbi:phage tail tip protein [Klebsiella pneumoniae]|uniref:phage tail tip fiber protein n=3 Tax=Klebsiella pneumoniae TaxID=573 RepID=UPI00234D50F4|nr:phage tail protein [Klebsiella pneumoniae]MDC6620294.1 phage tail protein [Klebsiella pneumoniae]
MDQFKKKRLPLLIAGAGGKKSSGSSRTPVEADDTVNSRAMASILDLLGEGVVGGLINGAKSIFIDGVALENEDGSFNYSGVTWDFRDGSQDQSPMPGFDFVETPKAVNTQLKTTNAVTVAIDNDDADRVRVIMKFPSLRSIDKKTGDTNGTSVQFKFQLANGNGSFYDVIATGESSSDVTLTAKKTGVYYRSYEIQLPKPGRAYKVRVLRLSADSNDQYLFNDTWVDSIGEIVDTPMNYPNSVLVGLKVNSEQFGSSMPSRSYLIRGLKIRVPSNYDENTNTYNGVWDGTFKLLSSSNPAWILFDLLTNARYGLGKFVSESMIDLGQLYQIGRYCDEEVDDGFGGKEKRFAINTQITSRQDAYRLIQDIAGAFRGMVFWAGGMVNIMQDSPSDPVMLFTNANVKDGLFTYKGSARKDRPSVALITYNNKQDGYKQNVEYVEDQEAMARYGERKTEAVAFGCTSRGQAHRVGLWLLYTARMESDMITFTAGLDASFLMPGETVLIQNKYRAGKRNSGRIVSFTKNSITLDAPVSLKKSGSFIRIINQEGKIVERDINETGDNITKVTFKTALATADQPVANGVWTITEPDLVPMRARVVAIAQGETPGSFDITVVQNNASKYQAIDNGATLVPENTTVLDPTYSKPSNLVISEGTYLSSPGNLSVKLMLAWEGKSPEYWVSWRRSDEGNVSNWQSARATEEQYEIVNVAENGRYDFQLYSVSFGGKKSEIITAVYQVKGTMTPPGAPTSLTAVGDYRNVVLNWVNPDSVDLAQINVYASKTNKLDTATLIAQAATTTFTHAGLGDNETWYYWIRAVNKRGMVGQPNSNLGTEATTRDVLSFLKDKITSSELGKELLDEIDSKATQEAVDNAIGEVQNSVNESIQQVENDLAQTSSEIKAQVDSVNQSLKEDIDTVNQTIVDNIDTVNQTINTNISNVNSQIEAAKQSIKDGDAALSQEIKNAQSSLTTSLSQTSKDLTAAIQKETNDRIADVNDAAKQAADQLLSAKNELKTSIDSLSEVVTSGDENLARQISQIAAGTGEQFDSLKIWYFDQDAEGWTEDDNGYTPMSVTSDGWLKANNPTSTCRSPNGLTIDAHAYRFIKMRIKKVGNPTWNAKMFWIGADETGWNAGRSVVINEPEYDDKGIAILTLHDLEWRDSTTIRRFRFDFTSGQDADNYLLFDWIAVGRPTPGAGMAALQEEQQARANADTAEAQARSTLAAQIRGSSESGNLDDIRSGLIYQEKNARITADAAEASARESLQTEFNRNKASVAEELHTLSTEQASQASKITGLQTSLGQKADASAVQTISQKVEEQGNTLKSQGAALSTLDNRVGSVESGVSANSKAITGLQSTVTQQDKTLSSQSESITTLNNSLSDIQSDTDTAKSNPSNLLVNASFERDLAGWSAGNSVSSVIKASAPHSGSKILVCAAGTVQITQSVSVVEGRIYKLSSFVRCTTDAVISSPGNNKLRIGAATLLKEIPIRPENLTKDETWKEVSDTWKATLTGKVDVSIMSSLKTGSQYFDDVGFVDVTDALAIEANASATNALTSRVSSVEGTITSQGQQITSMQNSIKNKADASAVTNLTNRVTAAENQISSQSQSITSLSNSLDNANADADASKAIIGNMLKNNSFERGFEGWEYVGWTLLEAQTPKSGKYIIQAGKLASGGDSGCNQTVELQAGKTYRIGAWVRKSADFAINNAGNNKISLRNADLTPLKDISITGAGLSTNWALISGEYTPAKTASVVVSLRASVASGYMYLDDVFCVDVSNEKAIDATSNALSTLNSTVTQQGKDITSNSNSITSLSNQMVNGRQNMWVRSVYSVQLANNTTEPTFSDINGKAPISIDEVPDAAKLDFASAGSYVIAHYKAFVKVNADTTITMAPGSRVFDDTGAVYVNGVRVAFGNASWNTVSFDLKAGWSTVEFLVNQWTGQAYINLGFKLSEKVAQLNSALGMNALSNAISAVTSNVSTVGDRVTSTSQSVTDLRNSLEQTNANLANKADAQALSTLQNTVSKQGDTISSQGNSITNLNNTLTAARNAGDNLIPNYDFLQGATAWDIQYPAGVTFGNFGDGKAGVKLNRTTTTSPGIFSNNNKPLPLNGQRKYRVVVKAKGVSGAMNMLIRRQNKIGQTDSNYEDKNVTLTSEWQTITWETGLTASNADGQNFKLYAHPANAEIWVDTFKVFDITDEVKIKANSDALSTLSSTVTQQGDKITSQGNSITKLTNDLEAADANIAKKADQSAVTTLTGRVEKTESGLTAANSNITSLNSSLNQQSKRGANLLPDGTFESYAVGHNLSNNRVIVTTDDSHGGNKCIRVTRPNDYNANATDNSDNHIFSGFQVRENAVFYMECWVKRDAKSTAMAENAQISIGLSLQYQDNSWQWPAVTKAAKDLSSTQWTKVSGYLKSTKSGIKQAMVRISIPNVSSVKAGNSFLIDDLVITEVTDAYNAQSTADANANAISTLDSTVSQQGDQIISQGNSITKLTNDLATTNNNVSKKADQSALSVLSGRVDQTESGLSSANSSITALNSSVRAGNATSGDLISNPTFDPEFSQMGFTVVSSSSEGVPANCPYAYVARIAARDHHPNFAAIPATLGDVYEMSALVACGTGSADFNLYLGTATRPSGSVGAPLSSGGNRKASATWQRVTWRFKITQGIVDRGFFRPFLQINQSSPFGTVWYVTDWHLRNVTDSSKVQDSLDATAKAVDSLTSTVNQQGENISSIGTRTTNLENNLRTTNANVAQKADANALTALTNRVTQTEKDINSTSSSVTNLNNKVDAISVGGTNLIKNSGDMTGWSNVVSDTYRGNAVISATVKAGSGYKDLREITLESPVDAGEYVYSFYAKGGVAGQTMTAFFYNPNTTTSIETSQGAKGNNTDGRAQFTLTTSWARYWVKWKQTPTTGTKRLILCRIESNTSKDQTVYINSPKFEVGNVVSDWNESPSDSASASAVDSLTTKVNQQGTSISSIGNRTTSLENGLSTAQNNIAKKADASALQDLRNTVTSQGGDLTAANSSITSLQASMNRRTVFTVTARGNGNSVTPGVFDESGKNLFTPGRSWALVTFAKHSDGSTVIATSKTYDVFGSANNGATMSADIEALASGTYVCVLTFDEPSGNRGKVLSALESLGGTSEVVNSLPYRGAYILLGRKGMKPGDGLELRAPTGGDGTAHISTSVEFVNGVMMGLGAAGGVMMKADANASAITTLQNTVKNQGDNIDSLSSSTTALENSLASSNASVDAASQIPGNLIVNPSFERGTEGYTGWSGIATVVTLQVPHLGTKAAKLAAGGSAGVGQKISFKKDRSYKIGIWAKQDPNTTIQSTDNTKFRVADGNGLIASKAYGPFTSNWQEVSWTWKATKDVLADVQFTAFLSAGAMYFDDFYVVDVTDSVETQANSSAITKLDSRVTKTENDITSQGSQVTQLKNDLATTNTNVSKKADAAALTALTNRVTQNEKEIETQSSQTTSLKNSLSTVQAMGSNPWFDGSLETYSENQQISGSRAVVVSSQKRSGAKSLRVSRGAGEGGNSDKSIGKWIALRENAVFRIELWAMMPADQSPSSGWSTIVGLQTQNAANNNNWPSAITITEGSLGGRGTWKKFTGTLRVATGHTRGVFWVSTRGSTGSGTPGYDLYIDDVVVTDITDAKEAQDSANANASALTSLTSRVTNVEGQVTSQASQLSSLTSQVNDASSKVDQMAQTITNNEKTQSSLNTSLQSQIDAQASANIKNQTELNNATTSLAAIKSTQQTQATTISALSQQQTNLTAQVGGQSAELQELKKTVVENGNVSSTWMVKMETNSNGKKYAAGIALGIDGKNLQSQFLVQADRFGLINTSNGNTTTPFVVENGVAYMNAAVIKDGSITNAKIGGEIRSDNFVNGSNGWRIGKDGSSQFNNVVIRGEVHANTGVLNNVTINENCTVLGTVQANKIVGDVVTMTDRVVKNWPASGNTSSGTRYLIATIDGMPFERRMVFNGSVAIVQVWRQNVTIRVDETTVWTFDSGNDGKDFETSIFSIRIPASNFGQRHQITIQWPNRGDSGQFRFTGVVSMYRTTGSISLA